MNEDQEKLTVLSIEGITKYPSFDYAQYDNLKREVRNCR